MIDQKDRLRGMLWGVALGDALGGPYEFKYGRIPYTECLQPGLSDYVTDDTEMTMALAQCLVENNGKYNADKAVLAYIHWVGSAPLDVGNNTKTLFRHPLTIDTAHALRKYRAVYHELVKEPLDRQSQSNGHLMRASPLGILFVSHPKSVNPFGEKWWLTDTQLSNFHPTCVAAADVYFRMIFNLLHNIKSPAHVDWSTNEHVRRAISDALSVTDTKRPGPRRVNSQRGWTCHALYFAIVAYTYPFTSFTEAMSWIIGQHLDSDTDTNAAIAGAILGLRFGYVKLLNDPITAENIRLIRNTPGTRPQVYHPGRIDEIIDTLV
jgi:ADP-ribosyl-[dinitrogen reductase] hydrolase